MAEESTYPVVTSLLSSHRIRLILNALGGPTGTGSIDADDFLASQLVQDAINAWAQAHILPGSNITIDTVTDPNSMTIIGAAGGGGSYTDAQAIAAVGAAIVPETNMLDKSIVGSVINLGLSSVLEGRISALEARSLIQIKDTITGGGAGNYMSFPAGANYIDTPSNAAFNVSGDSGWVTRLKMPAGAPSADWVVFARRGADAAHTAFSFIIQADGQMHMTNSVNGTSTAATTTTAATGLNFDGNWIWMRQAREASTGQIDFYTAPDTGSNNVLPTSWTTFQLNRGNQIGTLFAAPQPIEINGFNNGASGTASAEQIGRFIMYDSQSLTGNIVADANANDYVSGTSWTGPAGNVWTLRGSATVVTAGTTAVSNTTTEFTLGDTDAFSTIAVANHDTLLWSTEATLINTSGASANFTPKLQIAGVDLFTWPAAIAVPSAAGSVYNLACAVKVSNNAGDGSQQIARAQLIVNNAVTGTDLGSISMASNLANMSANRAAAIATITSIPQIRLRMTMGTAASTISARPLRSELFLAKAA
jgi:hypothetical protein